MNCVVLYYSYSGNTRSIAKKIADAIGAELEELEPVRPYTGSYDHVVEQGQQEVNRGFCPKLRHVTVDLSRYDTIVLGSPVWWYTFAPAMNSFLQHTDLSGKAVYPFATNGGWIGHTFQDYSKACPGADVRTGLNVRFNENQQMTSDEDILNWTKRIEKERAEIPFRAVRS